MANQIPKQQRATLREWWEQDKVQGFIAQSLAIAIFKKAQPAIQAIAREKGFTMILEKNEGAVLWAGSAYDITGEVNKRVK